MTKAKLTELRRAVLDANLRLAESGLALGTFGNVSGVDRSAGLFVIKPSGVPYAELTPAKMVPVSLKTGKVLEGKLRPSSDTATHLELYRAFPCGGIAHSHAECATAFAQARMRIRCMGTTHADFFRDDVPVTRPLTAGEVETDYERHTGLVIVETFLTLEFLTKYKDRIEKARQIRLRFIRGEALAPRRSLTVDDLQEAIRCRQPIVIDEKTALTPGVLDLANNAALR